MFVEALRGLVVLMVIGVLYPIAWLADFNQGRR